MSDNEQKDEKKKILCTHCGKIIKKEDGVWIHCINTQRNCSAYAEPYYELYESKGYGNIVIARNKEDGSYAVCNIDSNKYGEDCSEVLFTDVDVSDVVSAAQQEIKNLKMCESEQVKKLQDMIAELRIELERLKKENLLLKKGITISGADIQGGLKVLKAFEVDGQKFKELSAIKDVKL